MQSKFTINLELEELFALYVQICQLYDRAHPEFVEKHFQSAYPAVHAILQQAPIDMLNLQQLQQIYNMNVDLWNLSSAHKRLPCDYWNKEDDSL